MERHLFQFNSFGFVYASILFLYLHTNTQYNELNVSILFLVNLICVSLPFCCIMQRESDEYSHNKSRSKDNVH